MFTFSFICLTAFAYLSIFEEDASMQSMNENFARSLETAINDPSQPLSFQGVLEEFNILDLNLDGHLDDGELLLWLAGQIRPSLATTFPEDEDEVQGSLSYESFKKYAKFQTPSDCETYIGQTDFSSEELWRALTNQDVDTPAYRDDIIMFLAMNAKQRIAPGSEHNCVEFSASGEIPVDCNAAQAEGACEPSSPFFQTMEVVCAKTCGFCQSEQDVPGTKWSLYDFYNYHMTDDFMNAFSSVSADKDLFLVDEFTHETLPDWEHNCKSVRRRLVHPCVVTTVVGAVAGGIAGAYIQCKDGNALDTNDVLKCGVRGIVGGVVSGAVIGGLGCVSVGGIMRLWTTSTLTNLADKAFTIGSNGLSIYAASSDGKLKDHHTLAGNIMTWAFHDVKEEKHWYDFGSWHNPFGRRE